MKRPTREQLIRDLEFQRARVESLDGALGRERRASKFALDSAQRELEELSVQVAALKDELAEARAGVRALARTLAEELSR